LNESWEDYQKVNHGNMIKYGKTDSGVQRYRCKTCKKAFFETKGIMFYRLRHSQGELMEYIAMIGYRNMLAVIHMVKGIKEEK
jgi:transposase-like protein